MAPTGEDAATDTAATHHTVRGLCGLRMHTACDLTLRHMTTSTTLLYAVATGQTCGALLERRRRKSLSLLL